MKVRIGIDVGGTFTDAVAINNDTYELIGTVKVPTTHTAKEGVAAGIVEVLHKVMEENGIRPGMLPSLPTVPHRLPTLCWKATLQTWVS